jgi:hypothetical protein
MIQSLTQKDPLNEHHNNKDGSNIENSEADEADNISTKADDLETV